MAIKSYKQVIDAFELFADNHQMVNAFSSSFFEQFDQVVHNQPQWPIIYVIPDSITFEPYINSMRFRVYCVDLLQRDRSNEADILNDTIIILKDLYNWVKINDYNDLNVLNTPTAVPVNNFLTELTVGWYIDLDIEVQAPANQCDIPFTENFILTGLTCSSNYVTNLLTCATLENCSVILDLQGEVISGGTYDSNTQTLTLDKVSGAQISISGFSSGGGSTFTGGTVTGPTIFTDGLTANTFSATTYLGLPTDVYVTGGTYSNGTAEFTNTTGGTFSVSGFSTGGGTFTGGTVSGPSIFTDGLSANTFSATTYLGLPTDVYVTGGTYSAGTTEFTNNTGGTFSLTGFTTQLTDLSDIDIVNPLDGQALIYDALFGVWANTTVSIPTDTYTTGATYSNGTATFTKNDAGTYQLTGLTEPFTGGVVSGLTATTISATTISGGTLYGDGSNLTNIGRPIIDFKGATSVAMNGSELAMDYFLIPANTFTTNDIIEISCTWTTVITAGSIVNVWFRSYTTNTPPSAASGQLLAVGPSSGASTKYYNFERKNLLFTSTSQLLVIANTAITDEAVVSTSTMGTPTFDTTVDNYIYPTMRATAGTATLRKFQIYKK
jgi:hypothetical protein